MQEELEQFRREAAVRDGLRYPESLKELARRYAQLVVSVGGGGRQAARDLGIGEATLVRWLRGKTAERAAGLCEVVVADRGRGGLAVISPTGWRVEGLAVSEVAELLSALA